LGYIRAQFEKGTTKRAHSEVCPFGKTKNSACALFVKVHPHLAFYSGRGNSIRCLQIRGGRSVEIEWLKDVFNAIFISAKLFPSS